MEEESPISYTQHITCFAVGTWPGTSGTSSAILRYRSAAVYSGRDVEDGETPNFKEEVSWKPLSSMTSAAFNDVYCVKAQVDGSWQNPYDNLHCYAVGDEGSIRCTPSRPRGAPFRTWLPLVHVPPPSTWHPSRPRGTPPIHVAPLLQVHG